MDAKDIRIVVAPRGWVFVGEYAEEDAMIILRNGSCIRRWGTSKGLGELAAGGPLPNTVLDPSPEISIPRTAVIATIRCNPEKWR